MTEHIRYLATNYNAKSYYVRLNGQFVGMCWPSGDDKWGASRYNTVGLPEVTGVTRRETAEKLAALWKEAGTRGCARIMN